MNVYVFEIPKMVSFLVYSYDRLSRISGKEWWNETLKWKTGMTKLICITCFSTYLHFTTAKNMFNNIVSTYLYYFL